MPIIVIRKKADGWEMQAGPLQGRSSIPTQAKDPAANARL